MKCPFCGGPHIQAFSAIYSAGTHRGHTREAGTGALMESYGQSDLAYRCSPPKPPTPLPFLAAYAFGSLVLYLAFTWGPTVAWKDVPLGLGGLAVGWVLWRFWRAAARIYSADKQRWAASWFCHSCGQGHVAN